MKSHESELGEPTAAQLAAIEAEWPVIAAEIALVDAEIRILAAEAAPGPLDWRRLRRARRRVLSEQGGAAAVVASASDRPAVA